MTNNDILRRLRYSFNFNDNKMIQVFGLADENVTRAQISAWLKKEEDEGYAELEDVMLATFLNGFITDKRGPKDGPKPAPESKLSYNIILNKLKIALNLKAEDIIELLSTTKVNISKPELSAFFRKPDHRHYRVCKAQLIRNFLMAIQHKYRSDDAESPKPEHKSRKATGHSKSRDEEAIQKRSFTARPNASTPYVNPKATKVEKPKSERKVLKLKPEDIWKNHN